MKVDNAIIHYCPMSPWIVKTGLYLRNGKTIVLRLALKDEAVCRRVLSEHYPDIPVKVITHY